MTKSADIASDAEFLAGLDEFECAAPQPGSFDAVLASASVGRVSAAAQIRAAVPLFLMMLIGVCVGAASSALLLHDRVARLIALWSH